MNNGGQVTMRNSASALMCSRVPLVYPKGGFGAVLNALNERLVASGAIFSFDTELYRVAINGNAVVVQTDRGEIISRQLVMSSRAHAPIDGLEHLWSDVTPKIVSSLIMRIAHGEPTFDGYVEIFGDRLLKRVRNVSKFAVPRPHTDTAIVAIQLRARLNQLSDEALSVEVLSRMQRLGLFGSCSVAHEIARQEVTLRTLSGASLANIARRYPRRVSVLHTVDLSDRIHPLHTVSAPRNCRASVNGANARVSSIIVRAAFSRVRPAKGPASSCCEAAVVFTSTSADVKTA